MWNAWVTVWRNNALMRQPVMWACEYVFCWLICLFHFSYSSTCSCVWTNLVNADQMPDCGLTILDHGECGSSQLVCCTFPQRAMGHLHSSHVALVQNSSSVFCGMGSYHGKWPPDRKKKKSNSYNPGLQIQAFLLFTFSQGSEFILTAN